MAGGTAEHWQSGRLIAVAVWVAAVALAAETAWRLFAGVVYVHHCAGCDGAAVERAASSYTIAVVLLLAVGASVQTFVRRFRTVRLWVPPVTLALVIVASFIAYVESNGGFDASDFGVRIGLARSAV